MKLEKVYDCGGEPLGDLYVNLDGLQKDTMLAINQLIYLDKTVNITSNFIDKIEQKKAPANQGF